MLRDGLSGWSTSHASGVSWGQRPIGVLVVDQVPLFQEGLGQRIKAHPGLSLVGAVGQAQAAIRLADRVRADVLVVDAVLDPAAHLIGLLTALDQGLSALMLVREPYRTPRFVAAMRAAGVHGLVHRAAAPEHLLEAIRRTYADRRYLDPALAPLVDRADQGIGLDERTVRRRPLSNREYEVLHLVADGLSNQAIAESMYVSVETVRSHIKSMLRKLEARDRAHAVAIGFRLGLLASTAEVSIPVARRGLSVSNQVP
jgi:DNA-binding NarL/FixJ family response regulator